MKWVAVVWHTVHEPAGSVPLAYDDDSRTPLKTMTDLVFLMDRPNGAITGYLTKLTVEDRFPLCVMLIHTKK